MSVEGIEDIRDSPLKSSRWLVIYEKEQLTPWQGGNNFSIEHIL